VTSCSRCGNETANPPLCVTCRLNAMMRQFMPREPRWRYWTGPDGRLFCWTTERMGDGKFAAFEMRPYGPGARTNPDRWKKVREVHFTKRNTAKSRAAKWYATRYGTSP
jgi:hypothetical protein